MGEGGGGVLEECQMERCVSILVTGSDVCLVVHQQLHHTTLTLYGEEERWSVITLYPLLFYFFKQMVDLQWSVVSSDAVRDGFGFFIHYSVMQEL